MGIQYFNRGGAGIHHSKYRMPIHYDTIEDGQNKTSHSLFSNQMALVNLKWSPCQHRTTEIDRKWMALNILNICHHTEGLIYFCFLFRYRIFNAYFQVGTTKVCCLLFHQRHHWKIGLTLPWTSTLFEKYVGGTLAQNCQKRLKRTKMTNTPCPTGLTPIYYSMDWL